MTGEFPISDALYIATDFEAKLVQLASYQVRLDEACGKTIVRV